MPTSCTCSESSVKKRQENKVENCQWTVPFIILCSQKQKKKSNRCKTSEYPLLSWPCRSLLLFGTPISLLFTEKMKKLFSHIVFSDSSYLLFLPLIFLTPNVPPLPSVLLVFLSWFSETKKSFILCRYAQDGWFWCIMKEEVFPVQCMTPALSRWYNWRRTEHSEQVTVPSLHEFQVWWHCSFAQNLLTDDDLLL